MNKSRYLFASVGAFAFIFIFDWIFHGMIMKGIYEQTSDFWRTPEEMLFAPILGGQILFAFVFTYIFTKGYENRGMMEGIRYGLLVGLLYTPLYLTFYAVQPFPMDLTVYWIIGCLVEMMGAGLVVAGIYQR